MLFLCMNVFIFGWLSEYVIVLVLYVVVNCMMGVGGGFMFIV